MKIYPWGNFFIGPASVLMTYGILKYQAFDYKIIIKKTILYSGLFTIISILYLILVLSLERSFAYFFHYQSAGVSIAAAFGIGLLVLPLRNKIQEIMDRYFFRASPSEIYQENARLRLEIEQAQRLKTATTLASGLAHEIKNPLTAIKTFAEYLPVKKDDPKFINDFSEIVGAESNRINELVNQLTDFARPGESARGLHNIHQLIDQTLQFLTSQCLRQNIKVDLQLATPSDFTLTLDAKQIKQVLLNIFLNAIEIMPDGGSIVIWDEIVSSETADQNQERTPSPQSLVPIYKLSIRDTGPGINAKDLPHIFDPFFTKKDHGTGLGLSVSYEIMQKHNGRIYAANHSDGGAVFILEFPIQ